MPSRAVNATLVAAIVVGATVATAVVYAVWRAQSAPLADTQRAETITRRSAHVAEQRAYPPRAKDRPQQATPTAPERPGPGAARAAP